MPTVSNCSTVFAFYMIAALGYTFLDSPLLICCQAINLSLPCDEALWKEHLGLNGAHLSNHEAR